MVNFMLIMSYHSITLLIIITITLIIIMITIIIFNLNHVDIN